MGKKGIKGNYKGEHLAFKKCVVCISTYYYCSLKKKKKSRTRKWDLSSYFRVLQYFSYVKFTNAEKHLQKG